MNDITLKDASTCPICNSEKIRISGMQPLFEDARFDYCRCEDCGAEWRFYYKISDCNIELTKEGNVPADPETETHSEAEVVSDYNNDTAPIEVEAVEETAEPETK